MSLERRAGRVELHADQQVGVADLVLRCLAEAPEAEDVLQLFGEAEQRRHRGGDV